MTERDANRPGPKAVKDLVPKAYKPPEQVIQRLFDDPVTGAESGSTRSSATCTTSATARSCRSNSTPTRHSGPG